MRSVGLMILAMGMDAAACLHGVRAAEKTVAKAAPIVGVWRAEMDGLPVFAMVITDEGGSLSGAIQFYLIRRNEGQPATATPGLPEPILNLHFDGKTLTFQVSHRRAHPPRTLKDPPVSFRLTLTGADKGEGENLSEASPVVVMTRSEY